jgi:hypothetical protein
MTWRPSSSLITRSLFNNPITVVKKNLVSSFYRYISARKQSKGYDKLKRVNTRASSLFYLHYSTLHFVPRPDHRTILLNGSLRPNSSRWRRRGFRFLKACIFYLDFSLRNPNFLISFTYLHAKLMQC